MDKVDATHEKGNHAVRAREERTLATDSSIPELPADARTAVFFEVAYAAEEELDELVVAIDVAETGPPDAETADPPVPPAAII